MFKRWVQLCRLSKICKTGQLSLGEGVINGDKGFCANVDRLPGPLSASACSRIPLQKEPGWSSLGSCCPPASPWTSRPRFPSSFNSFFLTRWRNPTIKALEFGTKTRLKVVTPILACRQDREPQNGHNVPPASLESKKDSGSVC